MQFLSLGGRARQAQLTPSLASSLEASSQSQFTGQGLQFFLYHSQEQVLTPTSSITGCSVRKRLVVHLVIAEQKYYRVCGSYSKHTCLLDLQGEVQTQHASRLGVW